MSQKRILNFNQLLRKIRNKDRLSRKNRFFKNILQAMWYDSNNVV